jgi:guanylate kinase
MSTPPIQVPMQTTPRHIKILVVSAPSGTGKSTVCERLLKLYPDLCMSISHTTRSPRGAERDGVEYYFVDDDTFDRMVAQHDFLEWAVVYGKRYGSSLAEVRRLQAQGADVLFDIDVQGGRQIKKRRADALLIFLLPPSMKVLVERLTGRGTENAEEIRLRIHAALNELEASRGYDFHVINADLDQAVMNINAIRRGAVTGPVRQYEHLDRLISEARIFLKEQHHEARGPY